MDNTVELIGWYGGDVTHAQSAWTSTYRDLTEEKRNRIPKLLKFLAENGHHCYDDKTEILTLNGFKLFKKLEPQDEVCAVDIKTQKCWFEKPLDFFVSDYNEPMYYVTGQQIDLAVTKGHRMVVSQKRMSGGEDYGTIWEFQTSENVSGNSRKYLKSAQIENEDLYTAEYAKLLGFVIGDGHISSNNRISFHIQKPRKVKFLYSLGFEVRKLSNNTYSILGQDFSKCVDKLGRKKLPNDIYKYSKDDVNNILDGLKNSDGSSRSRNKNEWTYYTTSEILKEQLLILSCLHSFVFTERKPINNKGVACFRLGYSTRIAPEISTMPSRIIGHQVWQHYSGKVYCVTVSSGAVIVRRNGKICVSGNTPFEKSSLHFLVTTDVASHIHILKHRIGVSVNAESARYKELKEDKAYIPEDWDTVPASARAWDILYPQAPGNDYGLSWYSLLEEHTILCNLLYHQAIKELSPHLGRKRAKESARFFKPYASQITADVMFNFRSFAHFQGLRNKPDAQVEIQEISKKMLNLVKNIEDKPFKHTLKAFKL